MCCPARLEAPSLEEAHPGVSQGTGLSTNAAQISCNIQVTISPASFLCVSKSGRGGKGRWKGIQGGPKRRYTVSFTVLCVSVYGYPHLICGDELRFRCIPTLGPPGRRLYNTGAVSWGGKGEKSNNCTQIKNVKLPFKWRWRAWDSSASWGQT